MIIHQEFVLRYSTNIHIELEELDRLVFKELCEGLNDDQIELFMELSDVMIGNIVDWLLIECTGIIYLPVHFKRHIGIPDPKYIEVPVAVICMEKEISLQEEEITEILKNRLAKYMIPVRYWIVDEIPHTLNGKVSKKEIREKVVKFLERPGNGRVWIINDLSPATVEYE